LQPSGDDLIVNAEVRRIASFIFLSLFAISSIFAAGERNTFHPLQFSTGKFHGCPPDGRGERRDPYLCILKNRDKAPPGGKIYTVAQLYRVTPSLPGRKVNRDTWTAQQQDLAARWERRGVMVQGYLLDSVAEGAESCNCGDETYVDHHLWLAGSPTASKARAMVVEVSPRTWLMHSTWRDNKTFKQLVRAKTKVRVAGWLMWDQEHQPHVGHSRLTLWEIHPIHTIQVFRGGHWIDI
jgi:hypothetical protein